MPRQSLKAEKTETILQAYEKCIARYGVYGTTLQKVADEANIARPLLRHYVGNQNELLKECSLRFVNRSLVNIKEMLELKTVDALIDYLFMPLTDSELNDMSIYSALVSVSSDYECLTQLMKDFTHECYAYINQILTTLFPNQSESLIKTTSVGLWSISLNYYYTIAIIDTPEVFEKQSREVANILLKGLSS